MSLTRKILFEAFKILQESTFVNIQQEQDLIIFLWGRTLYLNYNSLPKNAGGFPKLPFSLEFFMENCDEDNFDFDENMSTEEYLEWLCEGGQMKGGQGYISKPYVDRIFQSCSEPISQDTTFYRYGLTRANWFSITTNRHTYSGKEYKIIIPKGTPMIDTKGLADYGEFIINTETYKKYAREAEGGVCYLDGKNYVKKGGNKYFLKGNKNDDFDYLPITDENLIKRIDKEIESL